MVTTAVAATVDITPRAHLALGANGHPRRPFDRIAGSLEANLLAIWTADEPLLIATFDLLYVGSSISQQLRSRLAPLVRQERLWLSASHTHRAPAVDPGKPLLGEVDESYVDWVVDEVAAAAAGLIRGESTPARLQVGAAMARHSIHRRQWGRIALTRQGVRRPGMTMAPNYGGPTDEVVSRADWVDEQGRLLAMMWHYTCHPTAAPDRLAVNSEYPGVIRERIRRQSDVPVLFFQGFSGDTRPPSIARFRDDPIRRVRLGRHFRDFTSSEYDTWATSLAEIVASTETAPCGTSDIRAYRRTFPSDALVRSSPTDEVAVHALGLGGLTLAGVSAEPVVEHGLAIRSLFPGVWPVGCIDDVLGYVPTDRQIVEGGYEAGGFCRSFGCGGVAPSAPSVLHQELVRSLMHVSEGAGSR